MTLFARETRHLPVSLLPFLQQYLPLSLRAAVVAAGGAITSDDAVAGDIRIVVFVEDIANCTKGARTSGTFRNLLVGHRLTFGNLHDDGAHPIGKG